MTASAKSTDSVPKGFCRVLRHVRLGGGVGCIAREIASRISNCKAGLIGYFVFSLH